MSLIEPPGTVFHPVGEKGDAQKALVPGKFQSMGQQPAPIALPPMIPVDHEVLEDQHKASLGRADSDQEVDHPDDALLVTEHKDPPSVRLLEDEAQTALMLLLVGNKVRFLREKLVQKIRQHGQIVEGGGFDEEVFGHDEKMLKPKVIRLKKKFIAALNHRGRMSGSGFIVGPPE